MTTDPLDLPATRKARGAFFTPRLVSDFAVQWAIRTSRDDVLEPSCGEAVFLLSAAERLKDLGADDPQLAGFELHPASASRAVELLHKAGIPDAIVHTGDFLAAPVARTYAAVVGNPPYVRYQGFTGTAREAGRQAALAQGVQLTNLASSWAPFLVHSAAFLRPEGRLALVLPAELLSSNYAGSIRQFLMARFSSLKVVLFDAQVFPGVQTEALLLLAEGSGGTDQVAFGRVKHASDLTSLHFDTVLRPVHASAKWTTALVNSSAMGALHDLTDTGSFVQLNSWGRVNLGAVTGNNSYFALSPQRAQQLGLAETDTVKISPPGSTHLRNLSVAKKAYVDLGAAGARTLLFRPDEPSAAAWSYIRQGETDSVDQAFKCKVRTPWWRVPLGAPPDLFFTYMNAETVQLCANPLRLHHLNSVHGVYLDPDLREHRGSLALATLNSATMLSAEVVGRAYGGGILKMEPREAADLLVPSPEVLRELAGPLMHAAPTVRAALKRGDLPAAVSLVDSLLLEAGLTVPSEQVHDLRRGRNLLAHRRRERARTPQPREHTTNGEDPG